MAKPDTKVRKTIPVFYIKMQHGHVLFRLCVAIFTGEERLTRFCPGRGRRDASTLSKSLSEEETSE